MKAGAKDLRIGNWLINFLGGEFEANPGTIAAAERDYFRPIELTEEWLLRFGFKKDEDGAYDSRNDESYPLFMGRISIVNKQKEFFLWISIDDYFYSFAWTKIKYVHQLQNLYFALTGEELTTKNVGESR